MIIVVMRILNSHAQAYSMEAETTESNTTITTKHRRTRRVILKELMMTVILWWTKTGPLWYPVPREGPLEGDEASSLTAWAQGYREVRKNCVIRSRDVVTFNPSQAVTRKLCAKLCSKRNHRDETETSALHSETKRETTAQNVSLEPS